MRLIEPRPAPAKIKQFLDEELQLPLGAQAHVSQIARCTPLETFAKDDVVLVKVDGTIVAGQIWFHAQVPHASVSLVSLWQRVHWNADTASAEWSVSAAPALVFLEDILGSVIYTECKDNKVRTLVPCHIRGSM